MTETWLPVVGYEDLYSVSSWGQVLSHERVVKVGSHGGTRLKPESMLVQMRAPCNHLRIHLVRDGVSKTRLVHQLVLEAFVGPCPIGQEVRHLDGDGTNNHRENLTYGTPGENQLDRVRHGTHAQANVTECPQGHPYDDANTYHGGHGRVCRTCQREAQIHWKSGADTCRNGHPYDALDSRGRRYCTTCARRPVVGKNAISDFQGAVQKLGDLSNA